jgi:hypothetical protein
MRFTAGDMLQCGEDILIVGQGMFVDTDTNDVQVPLVWAENSDLVTMHSVFALAEMVEQGEMSILSRVSREVVS